MTTYDYVSVKHYVFRPRPIRTEEFDSITPDSIFTDESIKRQILITLGTPAPETPTIKTLITWLMDRR